MQLTYKTNYTLTPNYLPNHSILAHCAMARRQSPVLSPAELRRAVMEILG